MTARDLLTRYAVGARIQYWYISVHLQFVCHHRHRVHAPSASSHSCLYTAEHVVVLLLLGLEIRAVQVLCSARQIGAGAIK
jgi:hypothetical protein